MTLPQLHLPPPIRDMLEKSGPMMKSTKTYIRPLFVLHSVPGTFPTQHFEVAYVCYLLFTIPLHAARRAMAAALAGQQRPFFRL